MPNGLNVGTEALRDLHDAVGRFGPQALEVIDAATRDIQRRISVLEERRHNLANAVRDCEMALAAADEDDDISGIQNALAEAERELSEIDRWLERVDRKFQNYLHCANGLRILATDGTAKACGSLVATDRDLRDYLAVRPSMEVSGPTGMSASLAQGGTGSASSPQARSSVPALPLPNGFQWVPIDEIDQTDLSGRNDSRDQQHDTIRHRLHLLRDKILPVLNRNPEASYDHLYELDRRSGRMRSDGLVHPDSFAETYQYFFGDDHIHLDRRTGQSLWGVTNGSHRIKAARELGWSAVPAKVVEPARKKQ